MNKMIKIWTSVDNMDVWKTSREYQPLDDDVMMLMTLLMTIMTLTRDSLSPLVSGMSKSSQQLATPHLLP